MDLHKDKMLSENARLADSELQTIEKMQKKAPLRACFAFLCPDGSINNYKMWIRKDSVNQNIFLKGSLHFLNGILSKIKCGNILICCTL